MVSISDIRRVVTLLLDHLVALEYENVDLERDFFWVIPADQLYDVYEEPHDLTVGQLSESWDHLSRILGDESLANSYALVWLADVLRALGYKVMR